MARWVLLGLLVVAGLMVVAGVVWLWPDGDRVDALSADVSFSGPGVTYPEAEVLDVQPACAAVGDPGCGQVSARVVDGDGAGDEVSVAVPPDVSESGLDVGDRVLLVREPPPEDTGAGAPQEVGYAYFGTVRTSTTLVLLVAFVLSVLLVARWRGLMALVGLGFAALVVLGFVLPGLLSGLPGPMVGVVGSAAIMYVVLFTTHGFSLRTAAALAGTLLGIVLTGLIGWWAVTSSHLGGISDEGSQTLATFARDLSFQDLLVCAVIIAGLGVLNDVTITQASAVWEIRAAAPDLSRRAVFASGMRIGRDHIASTIYTIVFAYAGTALVVLMVLQLYDLPFLQLLATEEIGQEVVRTLATSIGLVLSVPLTTAIAVAVLPRGAEDDGLI